MNGGKCGKHSYGNIDKAKMDAIINQLKAHGATVTGNNPWDVDTHSHGIKLKGAWDGNTSTLTLIVTAKDWYVPCSKIWSTIDELIHHIQGVSAGEIEEVNHTLERG